jgi:hypothetical protein
MDSAALRKFMLGDFAEDVLTLYLRPGEIARNGGSLEAISSKMPGYRYREIKPIPSSDPDGNYILDSLVTFGYKSHIQ